MIVIKNFTNLSIFYAKWTTFQDNSKIAKVIESIENLVKISEVLLKTELFKIFSKNIEKIVFSRHFGKTKKLLFWALAKKKTLKHPFYANIKYKVLFLTKYPV